MHRLLTSLTLTLLICLATAPAWAKRGAPAEVPTVKHGDLEYRVRHHVGYGYLPGIVEAWDTSKNRQVWFRQVYVIRRNPDLEGDVQDVFITGLKLIADRNVLQVTHERGGVFELNLETLDVKAL